MLGLFVFVLMFEILFIVILPLFFVILNKPTICLLYTYIYEWLKNVPWESVSTILALVFGVVGIWQNNKERKLSNCQFLFDKRITIYKEILQIHHISLILYQELKTNNNVAQFLTRNFEQWIHPLLQNPSFNDLHFGLNNPFDEEESYKSYKAVCDRYIIYGNEVAFVFKDCEHLKRYFDTFYLFLVNLHEFNTLRYKNVNNSYQVTINDGAKKVEEILRELLIQYDRLDLIKIINQIKIQS